MGWALRSLSYLTNVVINLGGLVYAHVFGKPIIIINDLKIARDLLDKRGTIYSDRPRFTLMVEMYALMCRFAILLFIINPFCRIGWEGALFFLPYGNKFRRQRKIMQQHFNPQTIQSFRVLQRAELYILLNKLVSSPEHFSNHISRFAPILSDCFSSVLTLRYAELPRGH